MSTKELDRARIIARVLERRLSQRDAARQLGITTRTVRRLCRAYEADGPAGLASKSRGRRSNRQAPDELRRAATTLLTAHYADFGPTLATEKLVELHGLRVSVPTVRKWMIDLGLWTPKRRRRAIHQPRRRRPCRGELVQIDGSDHRWFEDRADGRQVLIQSKTAFGSSSSRCEPATTAAPSCAAAGVESGRPRRRPRLRRHGRSPSGARHPTRATSAAWLPRCWARGDATRPTPARLAPCSCAGSPTACVLQRARLLSPFRTSLVTMNERPRHKAQTA